MANQSIRDAFERMWLHIVSALGDKSDKDHVHEVSEVTNLQQSLTDMRGAIEAVDNNAVKSLEDLDVTATADELNYMSGATGNVQTQIDNILNGEDENGNTLWVGFAGEASMAYDDMMGNRIHETYATKNELSRHSHDASKIEYTYTDDDYGTDIQNVAEALKGIFTGYDDDENDVYVHSALNAEHANRANYDSLGREINVASYATKNELKAKTDPVYERTFDAYAEGYSGDDYILWFADIAIDGSANVDQIAVFFEVYSEFESVKVSKLEFDLTYWGEDDYSAGLRTDKPASYFYLKAVSGGLRYKIGISFFVDGVYANHCLKVLRSITNECKNNVTVTFIHEYEYQYDIDYTTVSQSWNPNNSLYEATGTLPVTRGGTGYTSLPGTNYTTCRYRGSSLHSSTTNPSSNGTICWTYE